MVKKIKPTENKARVIETNPQLQRLWAEFGELSAQQEILTAQVQQIIRQRQQKYSQIMEIKRNEVVENK